MPDALVLAGGKADPALAGGVPNKAFTPIAGRPMVEFVLGALRAARSVRRVAIVAPLPIPPGVASSVDVAIGDRGTLLGNVDAGLSALEGTERVLAAAADIPLLTPGVVDAFVEAGLALDAAIVYGVVRREDVLREFPAIGKTFVRLREGTLTGGSLILLDPRAFARARDAIDRAVRARKRPWELARLLGLRTVLGLLTGTLRIPDLEERVGRLTGVRARALVCPSPEIAIDVDSPETLALVRWRLGGGSSAPSAYEPERIGRP
jgi:molybdopterin-guanine dinucleotide biosynthesis protein A